MSSKSIVLGLDGVTALGLIRSLGIAGCKVYGINTGKEKGLGYYSKHLTDRYYSKSGYSEQNLLDLLLRNPSFKDCYVFPSSDKMVIFLVKHKEELTQNGLISIQANLSAENIVNKDYIKKIAAQAGFSTPEAYNIDEASKIKYPVIVKPFNSLKFSKNDFIIVRSESELNKVIPRIPWEDYLLEEFIENNDLSMYEIMAFRDYKGRTSSLCAAVKIRQAPPLIGSSSFIKTTKVEGFKNKVKRFLDAIEFVGLVDIELKYCNVREKYYFIECNFRAGAPIFLFTKAGFNLPYQFITDAEMTGKVVQEKYWMNDLSDPQNISTQISLKNFIKDFLQADCFAVLKHNDMLPFLIYLKRKLIKKIANIVY